MDIFSIITLLGGLAFFLYGMNVLSAGLERLAGSKLEGALKKITSNRVKALLLGMGITAAIQSSSAVTVMLVGLVNSGIMSIGQSIGVIMGSNIGTTLTAWILTLAGVESDVFWMKLLKPEVFSLAFAFVGIVLIMMAKSNRKKDVGTILVGFAVLMYGMKLMSGAVSGLKDMPAFTNLLTAFTNPILGVLVGAFITAVIQSSSASVGILQALAMTGAVSFGAAIPIIMGQNIGTCITALISSMGVSRNAKKVAVVHVAFNLIGTAVCLAIYMLLDAFVGLTFTSQPIDAVGIALVHTAFNVFTTGLLLPFAKGLEWIANRVLPEQKEEKQQMLDVRLMATPSVAVAECDALAAKMTNLAKDSLLASMSLLEKYDEETARQILAWENELDEYEDTLGTYLVQLSANSISEADSTRVSKILHGIGDFERLGDHAVNIMEAARELEQKKLCFSEVARRELGVLTGAVAEILDSACTCYTTGDTDLAMRIEPLEELVDNLVDRIKDKHILRLQAGECSIVLGFVLSDLLNNFERISDHCSNIGVAVIELGRRSFDTHKYLHELPKEDPMFRGVYETYAAKYTLDE